MTGKGVGGVPPKTSERSVGGVAPKTLPKGEGGVTEGPGPVFGPVETKVRQDVNALVSAHPMGEALAEMAFALARALDDGAGMATAAVNRELRANLIELARLAVDDDDDLEAQLSTPLRDTEDT